MGEKNYQIIVDAMGGDYAPAAPIEGALLALEKYPTLKIILTGTKEALEEQLEGKTYDKDRLSLIYTTEVIESEEQSPVEAVRRKKDSSMSVAFRMLKNGEADGFVSAGNTGAVLAGGTLLAGRLKGVKRPALTVLFPTGKMPTMVLDVGANMDPKPEYLVQFARMSSIYYRNLYGVEKPTIGLLNVGTEDSKGTELAKETHKLLSENMDLEFAGNVEARDVFSGSTNIIVADGFSGNVMLKTTEGTAAYIIALLKEALMSSFMTKLAALILKPHLKKLKMALDPRSVGGAPLLGVNGAVIKAHGNSKGDSILNAVGQCLTFIETGVNPEIEAALGKGESKDD